ncbi:hypothetical protein CPCC7001_1124 [Cyanobium sp. PCC 7001]|uniref:hypothetical protein n=1 Tax=Cyanobium sp. PCC 7001 TaxID=180281 RepID=UPI00018052EA|nr:hypothetical protein [Cyanobium sp. PCC 7001]EDY38245.1 hypothetical protein CPCC7001_1124 [Cyanobium sp. PCC 7001]
MAVLLLALAVTMALYHWMATPLIGALTQVSQGGWLPLLPLLVLIWLLAGRR